MKLNNNIFYILLITIGILGLLVGLHHKKEPYKTRNNLSPIILGGKRILAKENFENPTPVKDLQNSIDSAKQNELEEPDPITTTSTPVSLEEEIEDNEQGLTNLMKHLDTMEAKCTVYEANERDKIQKETDYLKEKYKDQLNIENEKIEQLKDLVNYYRKRYYKKLNINNQCRVKIQSKLDDDTDFIKDLGETAQDNQLKLNINAEELLAKLQ